MEKECYENRKKIYSLLKWIKNNNFENKYKLNRKGAKQYPQLKNEVFEGSELDSFIFSGNPNPFELLISNIKK